MRGAHVHVCGCFPTGRHYPGIAERLLRVGLRIEGLARDVEAHVRWSDLSLAVIDFETTGRDPAFDRVIEIGVVIFEAGELRDRHVFLVNPGIPVPEEARAVHGITDEELRHAPPFEAVFEQLLAVIGERIPVAYNAEFDRAFLHAEFRRLERALEALPPALDPRVSWIDPLVWAREIQRDEKSKRLADVCARLGITLDNAHRAASDAEATGRVLYALAESIPSSYGELIRIQRRYAAQQDADFAVMRARRGIPS